MRKFWPLLVIVIILFGVYRYTRPVPAATVLVSVPTLPQSSTVALPWPADGQAALGAQGYGFLASNGSQSPQSIASVAKVITALAVLRKKPVSADSQGPNITFGQADADLYDYYYSRDGSVAVIKDGEQLTEVQALEAMLLPSGNNVADSLASWAFGSISAYTVFANNMVKDLGMTHTTVADASGFTDGTTSTAEDLVKLGLAAVSQPVIAGIVSRQTADLPVTGHLQNTNYLLGQDGVYGIKTGNTVKAGGCYLVAAQRHIGDQTVNVIGAVLGAARLNTAITAADNLVRAADGEFQAVTAIHKGQKLDSYITPWGSKANALARQDVALLAWKGTETKISNNPAAVMAPAINGKDAGSVTASSGRKSVSSRLYLDRPLSGPSLWWRIFR